MVKQAKKWLSFEEQLVLLQSRGLIVDNQPAALIYLERVGSYRLAGYWYSFRQMKANPQGHSFREDKFIANSRFADGVRLYIFDKKLRILALDALERIELAVRVDVAYLLGQYDTFAHKNASLYHPNFTRANQKNSKGVSNYEKWLEGFERLQFKARKTVFVEHNIKEYGDLPIWVAIEIMDFGCLSHLFAGLKHADKLKIATMYGFIKGEHMEKCLRALNFVRNVSAHHSRLWNINIVDRANLKVLGDEWHTLTNSKPFAYFCLMQLLMKVICPNSSWGARFKELMQEFPIPANKAISLDDFGVTESWDQTELWN